MTQPEPTAYPDSWKPSHVREHDEALELAFDAYAAAMTDDDFAAMVERTRPGGGR
jgi:hypothetical protein